MQRGLQKMESSCNGAGAHQLIAEMLRLIFTNWEKGRPLLLHSRWLPLGILLLTQVCWCETQPMPPVILDAHCDVLLRILNDGDNLNGTVLGRHHVDIPLWRWGGMNAIFFAVWVD